MIRKSLNVKFALMNDHYLKKIDRVTAILTQLQSKPIVRAQDLAEKFDVSIRTIYRDVKL